MFSSKSAQWLFRRMDRSSRATLDAGLAFFPDIDDALEALAKLARPEPWGPNRSLLRNYLDYTVHQLLREGKLVEGIDHGEPVAAFNTGLLTDDTRPIFGFLSTNKVDPSRSSVEDPQRWFFGRWAVSSDLVMKHFDRTPERARYWKESPGELLFNPDWQVEVRVEHIVDDNVERFPRLLQGLPHLRRHALTGAVADALKEIEADPHLAVPAYHFDTHSVSLLFPLRLIHGASVDVALVVGPFGERRYAAWTVYPLDWAYRAARLIKAPSVEWLGPRPESLAVTSAS